MMLRTVLLSAAAMSVMATTSVRAQAVDAQDGPDDARQVSTLDEVVVTAQRRAQNLQEVPLSIIALTSENLVQSGVTTTENLAVMTPGLMVNRRVGAAVPYVRGIGAANGAAGAEASIATYVDGVYYLSPTANVFSFNSVDRVEVLKGPQGTLFGRNATGGLVQIVTRDPTTTPGGELSLKYSSYDTREAALYVTGGAGDVAADFAAYVIDQGEGFGRNIQTGREVNFRDELALRSKVVWRPTEEDTFTLMLDWSRNQGDFGYNTSLLPGALGLGATPFRGTIQDTQSAYPSILDNRYWGAAVRYQRDLGFAELSVLSAYRDFHSEAQYDQDRTPVPVVDVNITEDTTSFQNEVLLVGGDDRLSWTAGLFIFHSDAGYAPITLRSALLPSTNYSSYASQSTESYAVFAQGAYALSERLRLTLGARYTIDKRGLTGRQVAEAGNPLAPAGATYLTVISESTFEEPTYRLGVDFDLSDQVMLYASFTHGFKAGEYNTINIGQPVVRPESLDAFEVGMKSEFWDRRVRFNISAFHYDYTDIQLYQNLAGTSALLNAAEGRIQGLETEITFVPDVPVGDLEIKFGASLLDTEYTRFPEGLRSVPLPGGGNRNEVADLSGNELIQAPDWTWNIGVNYSVPIGPNDLNASLNYFRNSGFFWEADNRLREPEFDVLNAQISYDFGDGRYSVRIFGNNLLDEEYCGYATGGALGDTCGAAPPRVVGVGLSLRY